MIFSKLVVMRGLAPSSTLAGDAAHAMAPRQTYLRRLRGCEQERAPITKKMQDCLAHCA